MNHDDDLPLLDEVLNKAGRDLRWAYDRYIASPVRVARAVRWGLVGRAVRLVVAGTALASLAGVAAGALLLF